MYKTKKRLKFVKVENKNKNYINTFMLCPFKGDSIMWFGSMNEHNFVKIFGIGRVDRIVKKEKYDLVYMDFGGKTRVRPVIVWEYNAKKQILTLKRNTFATIYGFAKYIPLKMKGKDTRVIVIYARALQGWYVPTMFDIKKNHNDFKYDDDNDTEFEELLDDFQEITDE